MKTTRASSTIEVVTTQRPVWSWSLRMRITISCKECFVALRSLLARGRMQGRRAGADQVGWRGSTLSLNFAAELAVYELLSRIYEPERFGWVEVEALVR
jgi:hypothetical protein